MFEDEIVIKLNGKGCWLLANYSRNMVSTYTTKQLVNDDFEKVDL